MRWSLSRFDASKSKQSLILQVELKSYVVRIVAMRVWAYASARTATIPASSAAILCESMVQVVLSKTAIMGACT